MLVISALEKLRQEDQELEVTLGYIGHIVRLSQKKKK
jgi:hypothetical protein